MVNKGSLSPSRLTIAEILGGPTGHEAWLAEVAEWVRDRIGGPAPELDRPGALCPYVPAAIHRNTITITGHTELAPDRQQVADVLLDEAGWFAERLAAARAAERTWIAHMLVFTGLGQEAIVLSELRSELRPRLLRQGIILGEFHQASADTSVRNRNYEVGQCPWPCFGMRAYIPQDQKFLRRTPDPGVSYLPRSTGRGVVSR
jgi:hypothetical protein